jgi:hypothetical protein
MKDAKAITERKVRLPAARQFDRNCILAMTAAQIIVAAKLGLKVEAIVVSDTAFDVGPVAHDIRISGLKPDRASATLTAAAQIGLTLAAGLAIEDLEDRLTGEALDVSRETRATLDGWIDDGRFARLVRSLDTYRFSGERLLQ